MRFETKSRQKKGRYSDQAAQYLTRTVCYCNQKEGAKSGTVHFIRTPKNQGRDNK
jgi:hypothetical protein